MTSEANITANSNKTIWFGNPLNQYFSQFFVYDNPDIIINDTSKIGSMNVSVWDMNTSKDLIFYEIIPVDAYQYTIELNKQYLIDGYVYSISFNNTTGKIYASSEVSWSGMYGFVWSLDNATHVYSQSFLFPQNNGSYGNYNIAELSGVLMNTTYETNQMLIGFPTTENVNTISVVVKDVLSGNTLTAGSNYLVSSSGVSMKFEWWFLL